MAYILKTQLKNNKGEVLAGPGLILTKQQIQKWSREELVSEIECVECTVHVLYNAELDSFFYYCERDAEQRVMDMQEQVREYKEKKEHEGVGSSIASALLSALGIDESLIPTSKKPEKEKPVVGREGNVTTVDFGKKP